MLRATVSAARKAADTAVANAARAPSRAGIATVGLGVLLLVFKTYPDSRKVRTIRAMIEHELRLAHFDANETAARLDRMIEQCDRDLPKWRACREWFAEARRREREAERAT